MTTQTPKQTALEALERYEPAADYVGRPHPHGRFVLFEDVRAAIASAAEGRAKGEAEAALRDALHRIHNLAQSPQAVLDICREIPADIWDAPPPTANPEAQRAAFEAWWRGEYATNPEIPILDFEESWEVWQAATGSKAS